MTNLAPLVQNSVQLATVTQIVPSVPQDISHIMVTVIIVETLAAPVTVSQDALNVRPAIIFQIQCV